MKKFFISFLLLLTAVVSVNAQILRADELEKYAKEKYGDKWVDAATNLGSQISLDKNNAIVSQCFASKNTIGFFMVSFGCKHYFPFNLLLSKPIHYHTCISYGWNYFL